jgi:NitT/TauT family transport system permease protein
MNNKLLKAQLMGFLQFIIPFIVVIFAWEIIAKTGLVSQLPAISDIFLKFIELAFTKETLFLHMSGSLYRLLIGYFLAITLGIGLGLLIGLKKSISNIASPILSLLIAIPTIAWVPVLLITLGLGDETVIAAVFLGGFFAITYSTTHGIRTVDKNLVNAAKIIGAGKIELFSSVLLPGSLVSLIPGLRLAIGYSWRALVGAEMLAAMVRWGIGKMIYTARFWNDLQTMFLGLIIIGIAGLLLDRFLLLMEKMTIVRWGMVTEG